MQQRHLAAILFTDIVGYTSMMQENETKAVDTVKRYHSILQASITKFGGNILNDYGDGSLCTFSSAIDALQAALEIQQELKKGQSIPLRIGLHIGEITLDDGKVFGDGINIASRIQSLGQANSILFSTEINSKIRNRPEFNSVSVGKFEFKNVDEPIEVFALANAGLVVPKKEDMKGKLKESKKRIPQKTLVPLAVIVLVLIVTILIYTKNNKAAKFTGKEKSIAVLPFVNMSADKENEYFSDGMTEEITTQLSKISELTVIARASAIQFKDSKKSIKEIANELGVSSLLEGSVQKSGNQIRITAQLIDATTQEHLWADKYDRELKDVFIIQSEVAKEIARQLNANLSKNEKNKIEKIATNNPEAYQFYLQGNHLYKLFLATSFKISFFENSKSLFEKAISNDPKFALAHAALASLYNAYTTYVKEDSLMLLLQMKEIQAAWEIDSTNDDILTARGIIESSSGRNAQKGFQYSKKAFEINQNNAGTLLNLIFITGDYFGLHDDAKLLADRLVSIDPLSAVSFKVRGHCNFLLNHLQEAAKDLETALRLQPDMTATMDQLAATYAELGRFDDSRKMLERSLHQRPNVNEHNPFNLAYAYARLGNPKKAAQLASKEFPIMLMLGRTNEAIKLLPLYSDSDTVTYTPFLIYQAYLNSKDFEAIKNNVDFIRAMESYKRKYEENKRRYGVAYLLN